MTRILSCSVLLLFAFGVAAQLTPFFNVPGYTPAGGGGGGATLGIDYTNSFSIESDSLLPTYAICSSENSRVIVVMASLADGDGTPSFTYVTNQTSGHLLTLVTNVQQTSASALLGAYVQINPPAGSNSINIKMGFSGATTMTAAVVAFTNANQTTPIANVATNRVASATTLTVPIVTASGHIVMGMAQSGTDFTAINQRVIAFKNINGNTGGGNAVYGWTNSSASLTLSFTISGADNIGIIGVDVQP